MKWIILVLFLIPLVFGDEQDWIELSKKKKKNSTTVYDSGEKTLTHGKLDSKKNPLHKVCNPCQKGSAVLTILTKNKYTKQALVSVCTIVVGRILPIPTVPHILCGAGIDLLAVYLQRTPPVLVCGRVWLCYGNGILSKLANSTATPDEKSKEKFFTEVDGYLGTSPDSETVDLVAEYYINFIQTSLNIDRLDQLDFENE
ncbi:unnamed protein product [Caenorhabditis angaria]|uniref:Uncharacterized protein n=1 Tax=Caenorhabditis angaria TaxID=860376 RepID=A0A9P1IBR1_9PELO|nr:unnamed protein product [Caenorhabditis angaria]